MDVLQSIKMLANKARRSDGWENFFTGLGVQGKDKRTGASVTWRRFSEREVENLHDADDIAHRVVNLIPDEGTKKWIEFKTPSNPELVDKIIAEDDRLKVKSRVNQAWAYSRLYGGAAIFIAANDGLDLSEPLNLLRVYEVKSLTVLHRFEIFCQELDYDISSQNYGLPLYYTVAPRNSSSLYRVHYSRIVRFDGSKLSKGSFESNDYWHDSVLTKLFNVLRNFNLAHDSAASVLQDFNISILKLKNLADIIGGDETNLLTDRVKLMGLSKSILGSIVIDAEHEDISNLSTPLTGVDKVMEKINERLVAATGLPHTIILGEGSTGKLSGAGESEDKNFKSLVANQQELILPEPLDYIYDVILSAKKGPTQGKIPDDFTYAFRPLWQPNDKEVAEVRKIMAEADKVYLENSVLSASEVAESRFGGEQYSLETHLDLEKIEIKEMLEDVELKNRMNGNTVNPIEKEKVINE